jgi:hypothetical protein
LPDLDDGIRRELEALAVPGDPSGAMDRVIRAKRRLAVRRRLQAAALTVVVIAGTAGGVLALGRAFRMPGVPGNQPQVGPTVSTSPSPAGCPWPGGIIPGNPFTRPESYRPVGPSVTDDVLGSGRDARIQVYEDPAQPLRCRYVVVVDHPGVGFLVPIQSFEWLPDRPRIRMTAEIDGQPGVELILDIGGPGHPHRSGQVLTYEPDGPTGDGAIVAMKLRPSPGGPGILFPLGGEFAAGVDCTGQPGTIVVSLGSLAEGGDTHYEITRTTYRAAGAEFVRLRSESLTVPVGEEDDRWPELADDPFWSCGTG